MALPGAFSIPVNAPAGLTGQGRNMRTICLPTYGAHAAAALTPIPTYGKRAARAAASVSASPACP